MGDQLFGDLTNAVRNITVSRKRVLQLIGGAIAVAVPARVPHAAEARRQRKPPLAFVSATVTAIDDISPTEFTYRVSAALAHSSEEFSTNWIPDVELATNLPPDKVRAAIVARLRGDASFTLFVFQVAVPEDRIAVTLL